MAHRRGDGRGDLFRGLREGNQVGTTERQLFGDDGGEVRAVGRRLVEARRFVRHHQVAEQVAQVGGQRLERGTQCITIPPVTLIA